MSSFLDFMLRLGRRRIVALVSIFVVVLGSIALGVVAFQTSMGMHSWLSAHQIWRKHRQNLVTCTRELVEHNDQVAMVPCQEALHQFEVHDSLRTQIIQQNWEDVHRHILEIGLTRAEADATLDLAKLSVFVPQATAAIEAWGMALLEARHLRELSAEYTKALTDPAKPTGHRRTYLDRIDRIEARLERHEQRFAAVLHDGVPQAKFTGIGAFGVAVLLLVGCGLYTARLARHHDKERVRAERRLLERERSYEALVENLHEPICAVDPASGEVEEANAAFWAMIGRDARREEPLSVADFVGESSQEGQDFLESIRRGSIGLVERVWRTGDDGHRVMQIITSRIPGATQRVFLLARDVTEIREYEATMIEVDRMLAVGTLAAGVGHEINNPLTYVAGGIDYAHESLSTILDQAQGCDLVTEHEAVAQALAQVREIVDALDDAREGTRRVRDIAGDLRTFSRCSEVDAAEPVALEAVTELALDMADHELRDRARVSRNYEDGVVAVGNESRLAQVILNLIINAAQAIDEGAPDDNQVSVKTYHDGDQAVVEVRDTGEGIDSDRRSMVFEPFRTTKPVGEGTGLGLAISRNIVESMNGEIGFESTPGVETTFWVRLPAARGSDRESESEKVRE
ncbi:MAG: sensor histidine kinase [Persicimonas sp.]